MDKGKLGLLITRIGFLLLAIEAVVVVVIVPYHPEYIIPLETQPLVVVVTAIIALILFIGRDMSIKYNAKLITQAQEAQKESNFKKSNNSSG